MRKDTNYRSNHDHRNNTPNHHHPEFHDTQSPAVQAIVKVHFI